MSSNGTTASSTGQEVIACSCGARDNPAMAACSQCGTALPADARFCPACAAPLEQRPVPAEERKLATVLFADLVGSTGLADSQDPERTRVLLDRFYDAMAAEIEHAGGTVEKFVGDAVMAAFGAPAALEDHAERALHAALAMQRRLRELFGDRLALRIGVNTGEVVDRSIARRQLVRFRRRGQRRSTTRAGSGTRRDPRRRANGHRRPRCLRARRGGNGGGEGEAGRCRLPPPGARSVVDAATRGRRATTGLRGPGERARASAGGVSLHGVRAPTAAGVDRRRRWSREDTPGA